MNFNFGKYFSSSYAKVHLGSALVAAVLAAYAFYSYVNTMTYKRIRDKIDDATNTFITLTLIPVAKMFGDKYGLGAIISTITAVLVDVGDVAAEYIIPIPAGKTETDTVDSTTLWTAVIVTFMFTFGAAYFGLDAIAKFLAGEGEENRASTGGF